MKEVTEAILKEVYPERDKDVHKYDYGLMLVIGGSQFYSGSPALAAQAGFRAGVDMVQIMAPERPADIIASFSPNLVTQPLTGDYLDEEDFDTLIEMTQSAQAVAPNNVSVVIGGGLGRSEVTQKTVLRYLKEINVPVVIDADAIHALAKTPEALNQPAIVTPHAREFMELTGESVSDTNSQAVKEAALKLEDVVLLKGEQDLISDGSETVKNQAGTPYMTTGGTGDVLAGICGSLLAQGVDPFSAAQAAAFINGRAGEVAAEDKKQGLLATDLIETIPQVIKNNA